MDTSPQYIKLCEKAVEIQELAKYQTGDWFAQETANGNKIGIGVFVYEESYIFDFVSIPNTLNIRGNPIWLPTQDQLQEMVGAFEPDSLTLQYNFMEWCIPYFGAKGGAIYLWYEDSKTSMEQLWLAYVMKNLYSKQWNGEDWVKE